jgi:hypothetical protein
MVSICEVGETRKKAKCERWELEVHLINQDKSAASFCRQVAAQVQHKFRNFYFVKNRKNVSNSTTTEAGVKK